MTDRCTRYVRFYEQLLRRLLAVLTGLAFASVSLAQSVPTDLMDMSIADLLQVEVQERETTGDASWSWYDPRRIHLGYRYVRVTFNGFRDGTDDISDEDLIGPPDGETYPILQDQIVQQAHSFEIAYKISPRTSAHLTIPYIQQKSDHHGVAGGPAFEDFTIHSDGIGDISLIGSLQLLDVDLHSLVVNAGLSFPSGSIAEKGDTPLPGERNQLPYTMQLGSGTWDMILSAGYEGSTGPLESAYLEKLGSIGWGAQVLGKIRPGTNSRGYRLGHRLLIAAWLSARPLRWLEPFVKLDTQIWGRIRGNDRDFPGPIFPTPVADPNNFGGEKLALSGGLKLGVPELPEGRLWEVLSKQGMTLAYGQPVYQSLNGPQPKERWRLSVDWTLSF